MLKGTFWNDIHLHHVPLCKAHHPYTSGSNSMWVTRFVNFDSFLLIRTVKYSFSIVCHIPFKHISRLIPRSVGCAKHGNVGLLVVANTEIRIHSRRSEKCPLLERAMLQLMTIVSRCSKQNFTSTGPAGFTFRTFFRAIKH